MQRENHENGWSFTGWAPKVEDTVSGSATYVAQWSQDEYTVTYQPGEHGTFEEASTLVFIMEIQRRKDRMQQKTMREWVELLQAGHQW